MSHCIQLDENKTVHLTLPTLQGSISCKDSLSLEMSPTQKFLELEKYDDPRQPGKKEY